MRVILILFSLVFSIMTFAEGDVQKTAFQEGEHYTTLDSPVKTSDPSKIEVTEVFWYGCPHCYKFEPLINRWKATLGDDVNFVASPAMWPTRRPGLPENWMEIHARAFYSAKALGVLPKLHDPLFRALSVDRKLLKSAAEVAEIFVANGVEKDKFMKVYNSFGVSSQIKQADARAKGYRITGTPEMVVEGKYRISARMAGGQAQMLEVASFLIDKVRAERNL